MREASSEVNRAEASTDNEHPVAETCDVAAKQKNVERMETRNVRFTITLQMRQEESLFGRGCRVVGLCRSD